jgi:hypothetical protein
MQLKLANPWTLGHAPSPHVVWSRNIYIRVHIYTYNICNTYMYIYIIWMYIYIWSRGVVTWRGKV